MTSAGRARVGTGHGSSFGEAARGQAGLKLCTPLSAGALVVVNNKLWGAGHGHVFAQPLRG